MPYPNEIVEHLAQEHALSHEQQQKLVETLQVDGMKELIEGKWIVPEILLNQLKSSGEWFVLPSIKAQMLVSTYQTVKDHDLFKTRQVLLSAMLLWVENQEETYAYIISPNLANLVIEDKSLLDKLKDAANTNFEKLKAWDSIKIGIQELKNLPGSQSHKKKRRAHKLMGKIAEIQDFVISDPFQNEYLMFSFVLFNYANAEPEHLKNAARQYFTQLFSEQNKKILQIDFAPKPDGDQLGQKMFIQYQAPDSENKLRIAYYVKTHQHGSNSRASSSKSVDAKELFIYKVFEYIGIGPKAYFFFNPLSVGGFFIATQDMSFTKQPNKTKFFHTYEKILKSSELQKSFLKKDEATYQALSSMDILARIFRLRDVTTNSGNFGCVLSDIRQKWQIIDFIIDSFGTYGYDDIFTGFKNGNGMYNYHGFLGEILRDRPEVDRIQTGFTVIEILESGRMRHSYDNDKKLPLLEAIEKAYAEIVDYISKNGKDIGLEVRPALKDLEQYKNNVIDNFTALATHIKSTQTQVLVTTSNFGISGK